MSLYDASNPQHRAYLAHHRAGWTPEKEAALQADFQRRGIGKYKERTTMIDAENIAFAAEAFNAAFAAYAAHEAVTREQSIDLAIAERSGDPEAIAAAEVARKAHGNNWHSLYVAQHEAADALVRATGVDPRKLAAAIKRY